MIDDGIGRRVQLVKVVRIHDTCHGPGKQRRRACAIGRAARPRCVLHVGQRRIVCGAISRTVFAGQAKARERVGRAQEQLDHLLGYRLVQLGGDRLVVGRDRVDLVVTVTQVILRQSERVFIEKRKKQHERGLEVLGLLVRIDGAADGVGPCRNDVLAGARQTTVAGLEVERRQADLAHVVGALGALGGCACALHGGQQQARQHGDNGDYHQEFDQREPHAAALAASLPLNHHRSSFIDGTETRRPCNARCNHADSAW